MNEVMDLVLKIAVVLVFTNLLRAFSIRLKIPPVVSLIFLGIVIGPSVLNFLEPCMTIDWIAQVGVLFLIFEAGIQTNLQKLKDESKMAFLPALGGVLLPFIGGFALSYVYTSDLYESLFIGTIFTATSISISVITLIELDKLKTIEGRCIVNAAIIDDILGILLVSIISGFAIKSEVASSGFFQNTTVITLIKMVIFFIVAFLVGIFVLPLVYENSKKLKLEASILSLSVAIIFIYSWFAENFGLAAIIGAFLAGIFIGQTEYQHRIDSEIAQVGKSFFVDFFFIGIGLKLHLSELTINPIFLILFLLIAIISKALGAGLGARMGHFDTTRAIRIGLGMVPRGEVALIIGSMALSRNLITDDIFSATVIMVLVTSTLPPFLIKYSFTKLKKDTF
ncbi:MAG: cation:proton antiporter [Candidatus Cloacimonadia bacterium]